MCKKAEITNSKRGFTVKQLNQLNLEEFRLFRNFTIEQMIDILQISVGKYESVNDQKVTYYAHCQEINNLLIEEVGKEIKEVCERYGVNLCAKKESIIENTLKCNDEKITHSMYILSRAFIKKSIS